MKRMLAFSAVLVLSLSLICAPALASCSHSWTSWERTFSEERPSQSLTGCIMLYEILERFCIYCGKVETTESVTELPHIWLPYGSGYRCSRCGNSIGSVR